MLLQPPHHCGLDVFVCAEHRQDLCFARAQKTRKVHGETSGLCGGRSSNFQHMEHRVSWTAMATWDPALPGAVVLHDGTPRGHAETPSVDGGTEDGGFHSTAVLYNDAGV